MSHKRPVVKAAVFFFALLLLPLSGIAQTPAPPAAGSNTIRLLISPGLIFLLPLEVGIDKGFFTQAGVNVVPVIHSGSSQSVIPSLARGDVDVATISPSPPFFNQFAQGFDAKFIASNVGGHKGYNPTMWLVVKQDAWDSKAIRNPRDLRGKRMDGTSAGSEGWFLARHVMTLGALQPSDLTFTTRFSNAADWLLALRNNVVDVQAAFEPTVTQLEAQHLGHRWISITDVDPNYQESFLAVAAPTLKARPDVVRKFLVGYINACKYVLSSNGKWTPELVRIFSKWSQLPPEVVAAIPSPPYTGAFGRVNTNDLEQIQRFWHAMGLVPTEQDINTLVDTNLIGQAQKIAGVTPH